jgi:diacylglycerol kinase (ATP)
MKIAIILNGISRQKQKFYKEILPILSTSFDTKVLETKFAGHAEQLARETLPEEFESVIAAGGDGTLNQVLNGLITFPRNKIPRLGLIPLGSGNDFARTYGLCADAHQLVQLLKSNPKPPLDVGKIECGDNGVTVTRYFINECSLGMGPEVVRRLAQNKRSWAPPGLLYLKSIVATFFTHQPQQVRCEADGWTWEGRARVIAIANGKSFGHAIYIAPDADPTDGLLNTFIAGDVPLLKFLVYLQTLKGKSKVKDRRIIYNSVRRIYLSAPKPCVLEAEGEIVGTLPATISLSSQKVNFLR